MANQSDRTPGIADPLDRLLQKIAAEALSARARSWADQLLVYGEANSGGAATGGGGPPVPVGHASPPAAPRRRKRAAALR
jgi:hypothetical protein